MSARLTIHDTGRRYFASTAEAFAEAERKTIEYACAIERHRPAQSERGFVLLCLAALCAFIVLVLGGWLPGGAR